MGVSLVYLGRNDDDQEMHNMCQAIAKKLRRARIQVQETNSGSKDLPSPNAVTYNDVWFCGHSRFVEAQQSIRSIHDRNLGGFALTHVAEFVKSCVTKGRNQFRLVCCESAQQQRYMPAKVGESPNGMAAVLGKELVQSVTNTRLLDQFNTGIDARVSHLEGLILAMADLWRADKRNRNHREFVICGLWGAGDITDDDIPITSFLQAGGSLEAQAKMDKATGQKKDKLAATFRDAHCTNQGLPDFFGYKIRANLLVEWVPTQRQQQGDNA